MIIAVEGVHGVGKTTVLSFLRRRGFRVLFEDEIPEIQNLELRQRKFVEMHIAKLKMVADSKGTPYPVFLDRCPLSVLAYSYAFEKRFGAIGLYNRVLALVEQIPIKPDVVIFLSYPREVIKERIIRRGTAKNRFWELDDDFLDFLEEGFSLNREVYGVDCINVSLNGTEDVVKVAAKIFMSLEEHGYIEG